MKKIKEQNFRMKGFTLGELLLVLAIIGILVTLILPDQAGVITTAKEKEAQLQLKHLYSLQQYHFNINSKYTNSLEDIDFSAQQLVTEGGSANYKIEIVEASPSGFKARATAVVDFDKDGVYNVWEIDQNQKLERIVKD